MNRTKEARPDETIMKMLSDFGDLGFDNISKMISEI